MASRKALYLNCQWLSRMAKARPLGRNLSWCGELLSAGIAINEARERLEAMMRRDGWLVVQPLDPYAEMYGHWLN